MPTSQQVKKAIEAYFDAWNREDREAYIACWAEDTILEDPIGGPKKRGIKSVEETWDRSVQTGGIWKLQPVLVLVSGNEAGLHVKNINTKTDVVTESIEFWRFNDDCKIDCCRTFFKTSLEGALGAYWVAKDLIQLDSMR